MLGVQTFNRNLFCCGVNNLTENVATIPFMNNPNRNWENKNKTFRNYSSNRYFNANFAREALNKAVFLHFMSYFYFLSAFVEGTV